MAASVRIEDEAFSDRRYDVLAAELGVPNADCARGMMAAVWRQCTAQQRHVLSAALVNAILGPNGARAVVVADLGVEVDGGIRVRGTKGRIEWLGKLRKNAKKGGAAKAAKRQGGGKQEAGIWQREKVPDACPPAPAPAPAPSPSPAQKKHARRRDGDPIPTDWSPTDAHRARAQSLGVNLELQAERFRAHAEANSRTQANWNAAFTQWLLDDRSRPRQGSLSVVPDQPIRRIKTLNP